MNVSTRHAKLRTSASLQQLDCIRVQVIVSLHFVSMVNLCWEQGDNCEHLTAVDEARIPLRHYNNTVVARAQLNSMLDILE